MKTINDVATAARAIKRYADSLPNSDDGNEAYAIGELRHQANILVGRVATVAGFRDLNRQDDDAHEQEMERRREANIGANLPTGMADQLTRDVLPDGRTRFAAEASR